VPSIRDDVHLPQLLNLENWKELEDRKFSFESCSARWLQTEGGERRTLPILRCG
jgi:hypothetical protein